MEQNKKLTYGNYIFQALSVLVPGVLAFVLVLTAFSQFLRESKQNTLERNEAYIKDFTLSVATKLDEKFDTATNAVDAIAKMNAEKLLSWEDIPNVLADIETETQFDHVRFVDENGISHTSVNTTADVSDRTYFKEGMKGNMGTTYVTNSRLTDQRQIGFYAPLTYEGKIRGVIVAFYDEKTLLTSIEYEFYGQKSSVGIITQEGKMIINSPSAALASLYEAGLPEDVCDLLDTPYIDEENSQKVENAYTNMEETAFELQLGETTTIGYMAPISSVNMNVYMTFPEEAMTAMYENGIAAGEKLEKNLILIFMGLVVYLLGLGVAKIYKAKMIQEDLLEASNRDELTGLLNRNAYENDVALYKGQELPANLVYATFDINGLKTANDTLGHAAGDELIIGAARCLQDCFGSLGKVYRVGGDEFAAILTTDEESLEQAKNRLKEAVSSWTGKHVEHLYVSCGYVMRGETDKTDLRELAHLADEKMYAEKAAFYRETGKDRRGQR